MAQDKHFVQIELSDLEWEVIEKALSMPIRDALVRAIREMGIEATEDEIMDAWDSASEKFRESW